MENLKNPITGLPVHEAIDQKEAKKRGYLEFEFMLKYLEDENENIKYFSIEGHEVVVNMNNPTVQYKMKPTLDYERVLATPGLPENLGAVRIEPGVQACSLDEGCMSCSG